MSKSVPPSLGANAFTCPHCGAFADQSWFRCFIERLDKGKEPGLVSHDPTIAEAIDTIQDKRERSRIEAFFERLEINRVTYREVEWANNNMQMENFSLTLCRSCSGFAVWVIGSVVYPATDGGHTPHDDMPPNVRDIFIEAANIAQLSPRGAAALLRLAIELLMPHLQAEGRDLNAKIGFLVKKGLDPVIQQALDVVRVTGNNMVHPGQIDPADDPSAASKLFGLINLIVVTMISAKNQIAEMFNSLPDGAKEAIEKRDATKPI
jgi:hypothetical protein